MNLTIYVYLNLEGHNGDMNQSRLQLLAKESLRVDEGPNIHDDLLKM
ncbi:hypothetical protein NVIRPANT_00821 [Pantoea sp. Nvir]|nr:hypothetical protein NVIRPANT_00821 [Pantoea sp. Nvir]